MISLSHGSKIHCGLSLCHILNTRASHTYYLGLLDLTLNSFHIGLISRRPGEPPLDKGFIPWLGHALEFGRDAAKFMTDMRKKHGDIYTVQAAGKFVTVLLDPHSYEAVLWESRSKLDFGQYARILMDRMFEVPFLHEQTLQNKNLPTLTKAMFFNLRTILLSDPDRASQQWKEEGLFHLSYSTMTAGIKLKTWPSPWIIYTEFYKLDRLLMKAARSILSAGWCVWKHLWKLLSVKRLDCRANRSVWLDSYKQHLVDLGLDENMQTRAMLLQLWSTQSNAGPAVFWLLLFLLKYPSAMAAVQGEMEAIFRSRRQKIGQMHGISQEILDCTPIFDSALNEMLRLTAAPFITREVLQDMCLRLADGREYSLRKGDRLCLFPFISPQMDPEIYEEPEVKYDRFLNSDGTEKTDFYKGGKSLKYYSMPWGAGINVLNLSCYFSHFRCVFLLLSYFDLELKDPNAAIPAFDKERYGFGMLQPEKDVIIRYKLKAQ
uniref:Prostacyclin synthase n=1 Tax=Podarcis muralis TaxID=64176 RepID=A0A670IW13_PODMU